MVLLHAALDKVRSYLLPAPLFASSSVFYLPPVDDSVCFRSRKQTVRFGAGSAMAAYGFSILRSSPWCAASGDDANYVYAIALS